LHTVTYRVSTRNPKAHIDVGEEIPDARAGKDKYWDAEIKGQVLFVGKRPKT